MNLVELALATNIPKGCAETMVRGRTRRSLSAWGCCGLFSFLLIVFVSLAVHVSYLDGKGNLEPQGTGKIHFSISVFFLIFYHHFTH